MAATVIGESIKVEASHLAVQRINTGQQDVSPCAENGWLLLWEQAAPYGQGNGFVLENSIIKNIVGTFLKRTNDLLVKYYLPKWSTSRPLIKFADNSRRRMTWSSAPRLSSKFIIAKFWQLTMNYCEIYVSLSSLNTCCVLTLLSHREKKTNYIQFLFYLVIYFSFSLLLYIVPRSWMWPIFIHDGEDSATVALMRPRQVVSCECVSQACESKSPSIPTADTCSRLHQEF